MVQPLFESVFGGCDCALAWLEIAEFPSGRGGFLALFRLNRVGQDAQAGNGDFDSVAGRERAYA